MGQVDTCCKTDPNITHQMLLTAKKMHEPQETGGYGKTTTHNYGYLLPAGGIQNVWMCQPVGAPVMNDQVLATLATLKPLKITQNYEQGKQKPEYYKFQKTGITYKGEWRQKIPHGLGHNHYPNNGYYEGTFIEGVPFGYGRFINQNGDYYEGDIKFGRANGVGVYQSWDGTYGYRGSFKDNQKYGIGVEKAGLAVFQGSFQYDQKVQGILSYGDHTYEGAFCDDKFNGKGKLTTPKGVYIGNFRDGVQHGYGEYTWKDGSIYRGYYKFGEREGEGQYFNSKNSSIARGIWKQGILNGVGLYIEPTGTKHKCIWQNSKIKALIE